MSLEDPYLIVQNEVFDALHKLRNNFTRWSEIQSSSSNSSNEDLSAFITELKNGLKSIQWDLDELEESLENSKHSNLLDDAELQKRKSFIDQTRDEIKSMTDQLAKGNSKSKKIDFNTINFGSQQLTQTGTKYYRLINEPDMTSNLSKQNIDDEDHKSPYFPNHSITIDAAENNINVIDCSRRDRLENLRQIWSTMTNPQKLMASFAGTALLIIFLYTVIL
ncbi:Syntaxin-10 [Sarcoptes scabiei]|uniref:Syntaxin-10 n=1 Tax=Sarcoptes scabiei TaxID=52283 RepID=A0A834RCW9_SARSC|nr:Syntaxin-10 [Sarcoptes scabiei]